MLDKLKNTQSEIVKEISNLIRSDCLPSCILFSGPKYSGRLFAANEISEIIGSSFEYTLFLSDRNFKYDLQSVIKIHKEKKNKRTAELLFYTVSMFLKQLNSFLLISKSTSNISGKSVFNEIISIKEITDKIMDSDESDISDYTDKLSKNLDKVYSSVCFQSLSVDKIREIKKWCSEYSNEKNKKIIILEGLETAVDGVSNALLKLLEEPPVDTYFIIISQNSKKISPTILSRLRHFYFKTIDKTGLNYLFKNWNVDSLKYNSINELFLFYSGVDCFFIENSVKNLLNGNESDLPGLSNEIENEQFYNYFVENIIYMLIKKFEQNTFSLKKVSKLIKQIQVHINKAHTFNQNRRLTFEFIVFKILEFVNE